ncbi:hypothetical protein ACFX2K_022655 [Malus domestica]
MGVTGRKSSTVVAVRRTNRCRTTGWLPRLAMERMTNMITMKLVAGVTGVKIIVAISAVKRRTVGGSTGPSWLLQVDRLNGEKQSNVASLPKTRRSMLGERWAVGSSRGFDRERPKKTR